MRTVLCSAQNGFFAASQRRSRILVRAPNAQTCFEFVFSHGRHNRKTITYPSSIKWCVCNARYQSNFSVNLNVTYCNYFLTRRPALRSLLVGKTNGFTAKQAEEFAAETIFFRPNEPNTVVFDVPEKGRKNTTNICFNSRKCVRYGKRNEYALNICYENKMCKTTCNPRLFLVF